MNAVHNAFDFRWNVKAGMKAGRYTQRGHCDCQLLDLIFELQTILNIEVLPGHQRVDMTKPALLRRGSYYAEEVLRRNLPVPDPAADAAASIRERVGTAQDPHNTVQTSQRVTRGAEAINAAAENAKAALRALKNMAKQPGPQRSSQQQQVQAMLGPSTTPDGKVERFAVDNRSTTVHVRPRRREQNHAYQKGWSSCETRRCSAAEVVIATLHMDLVHNLLVPLMSFVSIKPSSQTRLWCKLDRFTYVLYTML